MNLEINWAFGFSKDHKRAVHSLCRKDRNAIFLLSSHTGIIYDFEHRKQTLIQGHSNIISCCVVDKNKQFIVTADSGNDAILIVWDAHTYLPIKTIILPHHDGAVAVDFSADCQYVASLSSSTNSGDQELCVWSVASEDNTPIQRSSVPHGDLFHDVKFNPSNSSQLVTTSATSVHFWDWSNYSLEFYKGKVSKTDLGFFSGELTTTIFLPESEMGLTATSHGYIIVWENRKEASANIKAAVKVVRLLECGINLLDVTANQYLVLGCADGAVRFYDFFLRLEAWFEDLNAGPVDSLSFSVQECPYSYTEAGHPGLKFWVPDFIVGTKRGFVVGVESSIFDDVRKENRRGTLLMQGLSDAVCAISCHPSQPQAAILCKSGVIQVWNYELKLLMNVREFINPLSDKVTQNSKSSNYTTDIAYHPSGSFLAVAFSTGSIKILAEDTLQDIQSFTPSIDAVTMLKFSPSGTFLAAVDNQHHILLFRKEVEEEWGLYSRHKGFSYVGRIKSHTARVIGVEFGTRENQETLISVGEDRYCLEYDLIGSSTTNGLMAIKSVRTDGSTFTSTRVETWAVPTSVLWYPKATDDVEDKFMVLNSEFKVKEFNADSKQCRRTVLAPRYGKAASRLLLVPHEKSDQQRFIFSTSERIIGLGSFPINGDPKKVVGVVAHPGEISALAISFDGKFAFTSGGSDLTVNMWSVVDKQQQEQHNEESKSEFLDMVPFLNLLEGGPGGELHQSLIDYFYYCQLRHGGEDTIDERRLSGLIPVEEIPALMRSAGYYPSEQEVVNMINEVRYKRFMVTGETQDVIGLDEIIKLYVNQRPVVALERQLIKDAVSIVAQYLGQMNQSMLWRDLRAMLIEDGEAIEAADLDTYIGALIGESDSLASHEQQLIDGEYFATRILGFEEVQ